MGRIAYQGRRMETLIMTDFRVELRERLAAVMGRSADEYDRYTRSQEALQREHKREIEMLDRERDALLALLKIEENREGALPLERPIARPILPLGEFLTTKLHAHGPMDKDDLRLHADEAGYFNDVTNGRTFHTTLMNYVKHGKIIQSSDGRYAYPTRTQPNLFVEAKPEGFPMTQ
jgi:hypothetical protein